MTAKQALLFPVPDWIAPDSWKAFVEMRTETKKPLNDRSIAMIVKRLDELRKLGNEPGEVLDQSTLNCWAGVFEIHEQRSNGNGHRARPTISESIRQSHSHPLFD